MWINNSYSLTLIQGKKSFKKYKKRGDAIVLRNLYYY